MHSSTGLALLLAAHVHSEHTPAGKVFARRKEFVFGSKTRVSGRIMVESRSCNQYAQVFI
jgi:hypothetical protein